MNPKLVREYIRKQSFPKTEKHEEVKVLLNELNELERLAEIGRATEKAFDEESCVLFIDSRKGVDECYEFELITVEQLLEWAKEVTRDS